MASSRTVPKAVLRWIRAKTNFIGSPLTVERLYHKPPAATTSMTITSVGIGLLPLPQGARCRRWTLP